MNTTKILSAFTGIILLSACGSQVSRDGMTAATGAANSGFGSGYQTGAGGNTGTLRQAREFVAQINGSNGASPNASYPNPNDPNPSDRIFQTSRTMRVKVTPLPAPNLTLNGFTNWVFPYGCVSLRVSINGTTQSTQVLRVDGVTQGPNSPCKDAPTSQVLNFDNAMTGNGNVYVNVHDASYDNCRYSWPLKYGCDMSAIFATHAVAANIAMQNDGSYLLP